MVSKGGFNGRLPAVLNLVTLAAIAAWTIWGLMQTMKHR